MGGFFHGQARASIMQNAPANGRGVLYCLDAAQPMIAFSVAEGRITAAVFAGSP